MSVFRFRLLALGCILSGAILLGAAFWRPVTIVVDGEAVHTRTWARTVGAALSEAGIWVRPEDALTPSSEAPLSGVVFLRHAVPVVLWAEKTPSLRLTTHAIAGNILLEAGERLFPGDRLWVDGQPAEAETILEGGGHTLQVEHLISRRVRTSSGMRNLALREDGLAAALWRAGYPLYEGDAIEPAWDALPSMEAPFSWDESRPVWVEVAQETVQGRTTAGKVGEALAQIGLPPQGLDYTLPPGEAPLPDDGRIRLVRVREEVLVEQSLIPFTVQYQPLPEVEIGEIRILQAGEYGVEARRVRLRYENDAVTTRTLEAAYLAQEASPRLVGYGTKAVKHTLQTPDGTIAYWRAAQVYVTSYSPCRLGVPDHCNDTTYSGQRLRKGLVAVTRRQYAALGGTRVYVPGYGIGTIADIGAGVPGREWLDLGFSDDDFEPWHQTVTVYYLWPPPEDLTWLIP